MLDACIQFFYPVQYLLIFEILSSAYYKSPKFQYQKSFC